MHDSNRLQNHTPQNPFLHLKQQRKHHSIRPSQQATQHAQKQATRQTTQQTRSRLHSRHADHTAGMSLMDIAGIITSPNCFFFIRPSHPNHSVYFYFTACRVHTDFFLCAVTALVHISHIACSKCRLRMCLVSRHTPGCLGDVWPVQGGRSLKISEPR